MTQSALPTVAIALVGSDLYVANTDSLGLSFAEGVRLGPNYANGALLVADDAGNVIWRVVAQ